MKKVILILSILLLSGCSNKYEEYKEVSDISISLLQKQSYQTEKLNSNQKKLIDNFHKNLLNPKINISNFIIRNDALKTNQENSQGIYIEGDKCYIYYNDINFNEPSDHNGEKTASLICNGYLVEIPHDSVKPINLNYPNPKYNYRYIGYYEEDGYHFAYRSYYDGSGLIVTIKNDITLEFNNIDNLELKQYKKPSLNKFILPIIIAILLILILIYLKKKEKNYN